MKTAVERRVHLLQLVSDVQYIYLFILGGCSGPSTQADRHICWSSTALGTCNMYTQTLVSD